MKKTKIIIFIFSFALFFAAGLNIVQAADLLELIMADPLFDVSNAAPGQSFSSDVTLLNHGDDHENFQFEVDVKTNTKALADRLFFKVTDGADICLYGCAGNTTLAYLHGREPDIAEVDPHSTTYYKFIVTFDPTAGNEFQSASTTFDMKLGFEGTTSTTDGDGGGAAAGAAAAGGGGAVVAGAGIAATGILPAGTVAGEEALAAGENIPPGTVKGEETASGIVEGDQISVCQSWPKWVWVLMLIAYFAAFLWRTFSNLSGQIEKRDIRWGWQTAFAAAAFLIWYFFDKCREFWWFVIIALVGGAAIYLLYLYLFKKNIREEHGKVESESGQEPPEPPASPQAPDDSDKY